ncbi:xanthine dehydrogenase accessory protein XdhC [Bdellovibrio sp. KM01]|uniref:xanthine dehydrogenase accessory protein XdhC n=1 Tax=Bdellovibrio sp. KM01 TaxID=2748865 RepID=UPI0015E97323|nr:xanthine dehydrogenase accessory protein XdhC [Bdellovibrio sp. KM01]QLY27002.1 xanthine dehydrogenase accessory protein XdhC [Bdellovibrio sp. KM01]
MTGPNFETFLSAYKKLQEAGKNFVAVTMVKQIGSAPQDVGAKALVSLDGLEFGTVGGGKVEAAAIKEAQRMIREDHKNHFVDWNLQKDIGMTCGGVVSFFFELHKSQNPFHIAVFGAGHISQEFVRMLLFLDCHVTCFDQREEWISRLPQSSKLKTVVTDKLSDEVAKLPDNSYVTLMTMGHSSDLPVLVEVMKNRSRFSYVGNVGSDQKRKRLESDLLSAGISENLLKEFYCPMGETFGGNNPAEISFSIVAQILKTRDAILNSKN